MKGKFRDDISDLRLSERCTLFIDICDVKKSDDCLYQDIIEDYHRFIPYIWEALIEFVFYLNHKEGLEEKRRALEKESDEKRKKHLQKRLEKIMRSNIM